MRSSAASDVYKRQVFPLMGRGDINTYALFTETGRHIVAPQGMVGIIVPSGVATDATTQYFFNEVMQSRTLASLYDFENREKIFPAVDSRMKFCLLTINGAARETAEAEFVFFALNVGDLQNEEKRFTLTAEEIMMLNPNTGTMATFRSQRDAELTKEIYQRVPILIEEGGEGSNCLLYTSPSPRDGATSRMPSSA